VLVELRSTSGWWPLGVSALPLGYTSEYVRDEEFKISGLSLIQVLRRGC
jgi:hypothetical protein